MAICIVLGFEIIDIEHQRAKKSGIIHVPLREKIEILAQLEAVVQSRQRIHAGLIEQLPVQNLKLGLLRGEPLVQPGNSFGYDQPGRELISIQGLDQVIVGTGLIRIQNTIFITR